MKNQTPKFFDPKGDEIDKDEFVKIYSSIYLYSLKSNDKELEKRVDEILGSRRDLNPKTLGTKDITDILCWKTFGKCEDGYIKPFKGQQICVSKVEDCIDKNKSYKYKEDDRDITELLTDLMKVKGIGPVYAITMLYFLSGGEYPIYDKYAYIAIMAITDNNFKFGNLISYNELSSSDNGAKLLKEYQEKYKDQVYKIFQGRETENRDVDRALWIYGKLIEDEKWYKQ